MCKRNTKESRKRNVLRKSSEFSEERGSEVRQIERGKRGGEARGGGGGGGNTVRERRETDRQKAFVHEWNSKLQGN